MYFRWSSLVFRGLGGTANKLKKTYEGSSLGLVGSRLIDFTTFMIVFFSECFYRVSDVAVFMVLIDIGTTLDCRFVLLVCSIRCTFVVLVWHVEVVDEFVDLFRLLM